MAFVHGHNTGVRILEGDRLRITSPDDETTVEGGQNISRYVRAVTVSLACDSINTAIVEMAGPSVDVIADLKKSRVKIIYVCEKCAKESETPDA